MLISATLQRLADECREPNWDGYGARPVPLAALVAAAALIRSLPPDLPQPELSAEPDGAVALEWASPGRVFSVSVGGADDRFPYARLPYAWMDGAMTGHGAVCFDGRACPLVIAVGARRAARGYVSC